MSRQRISSSSQRTSSTENPGFTKGAIVKIYLKDFMTYNEVEFTPGPNLNLILGPNGTGKSTVVAAICLGMSGKPVTIARASKLAGYVRNGASKATIQIELHNPDGPNFCVTREITLDNKSSWKFQGKPVTHAQIDEIIKDLNIQVDNLCQFLPQEQVQNFSRLKDKQLLIGTMKAVGKPELEEKFDQLIKMQSALGSESLNQEKDQQELKKLQEENKRWESDVKSFKERESLKAKVKILEKKKHWLTYKEEINLFKELNEKSAQLAEKYDRAAARFKPLENEIAGKESLCMKSNNALKAKREKLNQEMASLAQKVFSANQYKQKMEDLAGDLQSKRVSERKRLEQLHNYHQQKSNLEKELEDLSAREGDAGIQLKEVDVKLKELAPSETAVAQRKAQCYEEGRRIKNEILEFQSKKKNIEDVDNQRLSAFRGSQDPAIRHLYEAVMWLRVNKDKFRAPIHEPPIISLSVRNTQMAKYVENVISFNDQTAFFCENKDDMNELMRILREEKRLRVNVVHSPTSSEPSTSEFQPRMAISELRNYGFHSFLRELFDGPEPVVRYLCKMYWVHNIPVGDRRSFDNFGTIRDQYGSLFPIFFGDDKMINIRTSRYRKDAITQMSDVRNARFLGQAVDTRALQLISETIADLEKRMAASRAAYDVIVKEEDLIKRNREVLLTQKKESYQIVCDLRVVKSRLDRINHQISNCHSEAIDLVSEERVVREKCGVCVRTLSEKLKENCKFLDQLLSQDREKEALEIFIDVLSVGVQASKNQLTEEKEQIKTLKDQKDEAERMVQEVKRRAKAAQDVVLRLIGVKQRSELPRDIEEQFATLPATIPEIDDAIGSAQARIQLMGRADERIVQEYEVREQRIEEILRKINNISDRASELKKKMDRLKEEFLTPLLELISRINNSFGRYYASMKCAGEVSLYTGEGNVDDDFQNYGIKIRVKYRSAEPLVDLSANHHSGGERAVATALYMLAMQELTQVPFRCVDEINQGMDPINERRVFDLLVETACREKSAQYFLLTPKLLPGLNYSPNMKIHFVQNGEHVCDVWDMKKHHQTILALK